MRERKFMTNNLNVVLPLIDVGPKYSNKKRAVIGGESVKISSLRLHTFKNSCKCVECGIEGTTFALERTSKSSPWNLELYGIKDGKEIMMTKDHIIPKSKGGKNHISNIQTMCSECNLKKGDKL